MSTVPDEMSCFAHAPAAELHEVRSPLPQAPQASVMLVRVVADVVSSYDAPQAVGFLHGLREFLACDPLEARVSLAEFRAMLARATAMTGDAGFSLRCGLTSNESAFHLMAPLLAHTASLRHALAELRYFQELVMDGVRFTVVERGAVARLRCDFPRSHKGTDGLLAEFLLSALTRMVRGFGARSHEMHVVSFEHGRPDHAALYSTVFSGRERFEQSFAGIEFASVVLDRPHLYAEPVLQRAMHAHAAQSMERFRRPKRLVDRLRTYLLNQPVGHVPSMTEAAHGLGMSDRSLRRRLTEEGLSYRSLTQQFQRELACRMLQDMDLSVQEVADTMGFTEVASFCRAFKRWTRSTPAEYRQRYERGE